MFPAAAADGTDLVPALLTETAKMGKSVYLFGGKPGTAEAAERTLQEAIAQLVIAGLRNGYDEAAKAGRSCCRHQCKHRRDRSARSWRADAGPLVAA